MDADNILILRNKDEAGDSICVEFKNAGFKVISVTDMEKALQRVVDVKPDVVILDADQSELRGIEICRAIIRDGNVDSRIIVISDKKDLHTRLSYFIAGADIFLSKPFNVNELLCEITNVICQKKMSSVHIFNALHE